MAEGRKRRSERHQLTQYPQNNLDENILSDLPPPIHDFLQVPDIEKVNDFTPLPDFVFENENSLEGFAGDAASEPYLHEQNRKWLYQSLFVISLLAILGMTFFIFKIYEPRAVFEMKKAVLSQDIIFNGAAVDGHNVGGLSLPEAVQKLNSAAASVKNDLQLFIEVDEAVYTVGAEQLPFGRNTRDVLQAAYAIGRQGFPWMIGSGKTPFDIRYEHTLHIKKNGAQFQTEAAFSKEAVSVLAEQLALKINREPQNSQLASFDFDTRAFSVSKDVNGARLNVETAYAEILAALQSGQQSLNVRLQTEKILPQITAVELQNSLKLLSSFSTETSKDELRNTNIALASRAIHGKAVLPGEKFSFNQVVGQRTVQRGYGLAPAIAGGVLFDDVGGGICQVSSTLFNAAAMADMTIVTREPHAWPVSYVEKGRDATVNWPNLDFVFKNDTNMPVFIVSAYKNRKLNIELYGMRKDEGESIQLETELIATVKAPSAPRYQANLSLMPGEQRELKKARDGYLVDTYRIYLMDGQVYQRDKLFSSDYRMVQQVIEYN